MRYLLIFSWIFISHYGKSQDFKPFEGELIFSVELIDSLTTKEKLLSFVRIYTNDTLVRTETESYALGKQILLRNLPLKKQYVLLEYKDKKYAIQQHIPIDSISQQSFIYSKKSKRFAGIKGKKVKLPIIGTSKKTTCYISENLNPIYTNVFPGIKGMPLVYYIQSSEGVLKYTLRKITKYKIPNSYFYFSNEYEKISFSDFISRISN
jgi:hypothetical protein